MAFHDSITIMQNEPRDHHYVPQFYLRNFSVDPENRKISTVAKHGHLAIWSTRSIEGLGFEKDLYVTIKGGIPISVESDINRKIETPISKSDTWIKIKENRSDALDHSDRQILYGLIRHLEARNLHYRQTGMELAKLATDPSGSIPFTDEERASYRLMRDRPDHANEIFNLMASSLEWTADSFSGARISILRSKIPLRTSTAPVMSMGVPDDNLLTKPLPGISPYQLVLPLNRFTIAMLVLGDFDGMFENIEVADDIARGFNRYYVGQFSQFEHIRHLVTDRDDLEVDMTWAPYNVVEKSDRRIKFRRR